jgi:hypothetical protein
MALFAMVMLFIGFVTHLNSTSALSNVNSAVAHSTSAVPKQIAVSLEDLERSTTEIIRPPPQHQQQQKKVFPSTTVGRRETETKLTEAKLAAVAPVSEDDSEDSEEEGEEEGSDSENSAAVTDLMSNEQYPVYDLPKGGNALNQVQEEINPADIPVSKMNEEADDEEAERKQSLEDDDILEDAAAYKKAPIIQALPESSSLKYREIVLQHERYYRSHPARLYVPKLKKTAKLTISQFTERFVKHSQPVVIPFEAMRHLGFKTRSYTLDEMLEMYPNYKRTFVYRYGSPGPGELDLGPAVWALKQGDALRKTPTGRNFPRNTKISLDKLSKLGIQNPPYIIPGTPLLTPSLWFATVTSSTKLHSDCCDNYAMMISGTKRWTIAPPHEARILTPACFGGLCWVKKLEHPDEHAQGAKQQELAEKLQKVTFDLGPNEMLFLPTGWFHHVENVGPTIMINFWTKGGPGFLKFIDGSAMQTMADLEKEENAEKS